MKQRRSSDRDGVVVVGAACTSLAVLHPKVLRCKHRWTRTTTGDSALHAVRLLGCFKSSRPRPATSAPADHRIASHRLAQGIQMHRAWACEITVVLMRGAARSRPRRLVVQSCSRSRTNVYISNLISREMKHRHSYAVPQAAR
jgi:hypothetical protein